MKEHPILFSTPMVQAILEGRKTQTRRIVKPQPDFFCVGFPCRFTEFMQAMSPPKSEEIKCPFGQPGDRLWVRETWMKNPNVECFPDEPIYFKASKSKQFLEEWPNSWKPSIHMPKTAARIWLEVEEVGVERLIDITQEDAINEGIKIIEPDEAFFDYEFNGKNGSFASAKGSFMSLWCKINGNGSWDANPWVWVIKFKVLSTTGKPSFDDVDWEKLKALKKLYDEAGSLIPPNPSQQIGTGSLQRETRNQHPAPIAIEARIQNPVTSIQHESN